MGRAARDALSDRGTWLMVGVVFLCVLLVLIIVSIHEKEKPESPQALVAAAINQIFPLKEWKPGMGKKPFMYHPAGFNALVWRPLPLRPVQLGQQLGPGLLPSPQGSGSPLNRAPTAPGGGQVYGRGQP
jgi:hypothetical protein